MNTYIDTISHTGLCTQIMNYFKLRAKNEKAFEDVLPATVRHVFEQDVVQLLAKRDQHGSRILVVQCGSE